MNVSVTVKLESSTTRSAMAPFAMTPRSFSCSSFAGLVEHNCAIYHVAEGSPAACAAELELFSEVLGADVVHRLSVDQDRALVGFLETRDDSQQRAFAAARRPEQYREFAIGDVERHASDRVHVAVAFVDIFESQVRHCAVNPSTRRRSGRERESDSSR